MVEKIEDNEMKRSTFILSRTRVPAEGTGQFELSAAGAHPKCRLVSAYALATIYSTAPDQLVIEKQDGDNVATATASATIGTPVYFTIAPAAGNLDIFERDEPIIMKAAVEGNAANATTVSARFETVVEE